MGRCALTDASRAGASTRHRRHAFCNLRRAGGCGGCCDRSAADQDQDGARVQARRQADAAHRRARESRRLSGLWYRHAFAGDAVRGRRALPRVRRQSEALRLRCDQGHARRSKRSRHRLRCRGRCSQLLAGGASGQGTVDRMGSGCGCGQLVGAVASRVRRCARYSGQPGSRSGRRSRSPEGRPAQSASRLSRALSRARMHGAAQLHGAGSTGSRRSCG